MASDIDTKINAYGAAISGATIIWESVDAFSEGGAQAGFSKMAAGVYDALAGAYIPGWGWFKLGATMVEGLGTYALMTDHYQTHIPKVLALLNQAQTEYARIIPWYFKTMPTLETAPTTTGAVGQPLSIGVQVNEPGGVFSAPALPTGLTINPTTGAITGSPTQAGEFQALVRYLSSAGVSSCKTIGLTIDAPQATTQSITIRNGAPEIQVRGLPGLNCILQMQTGLLPADRWVTVKTLTVGENWAGANGLPGPQCFWVGTRNRWWRDLAVTSTPICLPSPPRSKPRAAST